MLAELEGKGGRLCPQALAGELRCPLIVRPESEDIVTGVLFGQLAAIQPHWWLPDILNWSMATTTFRSQVFRDFKISVWQKQKCYPSHLLPWIEGATEIDVVLTWENPPTTMFIEMKYGSPLARRTTHNHGQYGFPADQLIRNIRIGLWKTGWLAEASLIPIPRRRFIQILASPRGDVNPLVTRYRKSAELLKAIPFAARLIKEPPDFHVGQLDFDDIVNVLNCNRVMMNRAEQTLVDGLSRYLRHKSNQLPTLIFPSRAKRKNSEIGIDEVNLRE